MQFMASSRRQSFILNYEDYAGFKKKNNASLPFLDSNRKKGKKMTLLELCYFLKGQITHFLHQIWPFCEFLRYDLTSCLHSKQSKIHLINFVTFLKL